MTRLSRTWTLAWAWAALFFIGMPKLARMAEANPGTPKLLAMQGSTIGTIYPRPCPRPRAGGLPLAPGAAGGNPDDLTGDSVHNLKGELLFSSTDLASGGFGGWAMTRDFSTTYESAPGGNLGPDWAIVQWPRLINFFGSIHAVTGGRAYIVYYDNGPSGYGAQHFFNEKLVANTGPKEIVLTDTQGNRTIYHDFTVTSTALRGQFKQYVDVAGNVTTVTRGTSGVTLDQIIEIQRSFTGGGHTTTESWLYDYNLSGADSGKLTTVTLRRKVDAGSFTTVRKVDYTYYSGSANGPDGYLQRALIKDASSTLLLTKYYRYYKTGNFVGGLKFVVEGAAYERAKAANGGTDAGVDSAADTGSTTTIDNFAEKYLEYDASKRVTKEVVQGAGCSCSSNLGKGRYTYAYASSAFADGYNNWKQKTTVQFLDDDGVTVLWTKTVYTNYAGEVMLETFKDESQSTLLWRTFYKYDSAGRLIWHAMPSAVTGHDETKIDLLNLVSNNYQHMSDSTGLVYVYDYGTSTTATSSTPGDVIGYSKYAYCKNGELGTLVKKSFPEYLLRSGDSGTTYVPGRVTVYRDTGATQPIATNFSYSWKGTTNQKDSITTTYPAVLTTQNGPGTSDTSDIFFDVYGRVKWIRQGQNEDDNGNATYLEYDPGSGGLTKIIRDIDTVSGAPDFSEPSPSAWYFTGIHLINTMQVDSLGRTTRFADRKEPDTNAKVSYIVYNDIGWEKRIYSGWTGTVPTGPTIVVRQDKPGSYVETLATSATPTTSGGAPTGQEAIVTATLQTLSRNYLDNGDRITYTDSYYSFTGLTYGTGINIGTLNTNYYRTQFGYDDFGNPNRTQDGVGTIARTVYDRLSRVSSSWIGTNDTPASGEWSPSNNTSPSNMLKSAEAHFDTDGVGDGNLTQSKVFATDTTIYVTEYRYDFRNRQTDVRGPDNVGAKRTFDNLNRVTITDFYADGNADFAIGSTEQRAKHETAYDEKGQVYQESAYKVTTAGVISDKLPTNYWYDYRGLLGTIQSANGAYGGFNHNGAAQVTNTATSINDTGPLGYFGASNGLPGNKIIEKGFYFYDKAENLVTSVLYDRPDDASVNFDLWYQGDETAFRSVVVSWFDPSNRPIAAASYGRDNGATRYVVDTSAGIIDSNSNEIPDEAENAPRTPNTSDDYIVTKFEYDTAGFQYKTTDNLARFSQKTFDREGRLLTLIENYVNGAVGNAEYTSDRTTIWAYTNGIRLDTITAKNAKGTAVENQITKHLYESAINLSWPTSIIYPDSSDTTSAGTDQAKFTYDRLGRRVTSSDQRFVSPNALTHTYSYDSAGRFLSDAITALPTGVDGAVRRIELGYDDLSRANLVTSYDAATAGNKVNEVQLTYDAWRQLQKSEQSHVGAVVGGATPFVQYTFSDGASGGIAKFLRPSSIAYPGASRTVYFNYPAANSIGDSLNRVDNVAEDSSGTTKYTQYTYMGTDTLVKLAYGGVSNGLNLDYGAASSGLYSGFDRFGRIANQKWQNNAATTIHDRYAHTYDRVGNRLSRDLLATQQPATSKDEYYVYDGLNRLSEFRRGTLTGTPPAITQAASNYYQQWTDLEPVGNWKTWKIDTNGGAGGGQLSTQTRKHNLANEIDVDNNDANAAGASITGTGVNWVDPTYDKAGNLKSYPKVGDESTAAARQWPTFDAWNRLVKLQGDTSGAPGPEIVEFQYDGLGRRVVKLKPNGSNWDRTDYYYSESWQCLEERFLANTASKTTVATAPKVQYVWDLRYIDSLAVRWRDADGNGSLEEKLHYCQDANANVTALVDTGGNVVERYNYHAYGLVTIFDPTWGTVRTSSSYANENLFAGYRRDPDTLLYHVRNRDYHPTLGRWLERDPIGYADGMSLYQYVEGNTANLIDPYGEQDVDTTAGPGSPTSCKRKGNGRDNQATSGPNYGGPSSSTVVNSGPLPTLVMGIGGRGPYDPSAAGRQLVEKHGGEAQNQGPGTTTAGPGTTTADPAPPTAGPGTTTTGPGQTKAQRIAASWLKYAPDRTTVTRTSAGLIYTLDSEAFAWFKEIVPWLWGAGMTKVAPAFIDTTIPPMIRAGTRAGPKIADEAVKFHHAWPKYLEGAEQQLLEPLPKSVHDAYHAGLDKVLARQASGNGLRGKAFYDAMSPELKEQALKKLAAYTKSFDAQNGTKLYDAMVREGFQY